MTFPFGQNQYVESPLLYGQDGMEQGAGYVAAAQDAVNQAQDWYSENIISVEEGLPEETVISIPQAQEGTSRHMFSALKTEIMDADRDGAITRGEVRVFVFGMLGGWVLSRILR